MWYIGVIKSLLAAKLIPWGRELKADTAHSRGSAYSVMILKKFTAPFACIKSILSRNCPAVRIAPPYLNKPFGCRFQNVLCASTRNRRYDLRYVVSGICVEGWTLHFEYRSNNSHVTSTKPITSWCACSRSPTLHDHARCKVRAHNYSCCVLIMYFGVRVIMVFWNVYCYLCVHMPYMCFISVVQHNNSSGSG